jgi:hypothetical protein
MLPPHNCRKVRLIFIAVYTAGFCTHMSNYLKFHKNQLYRRDAPYLTYEPKYEFIGHRIGGQKVCFLTKIRMNWHVQTFCGISANTLSACEKHNEKMPQQRFENYFVNWEPKLH